ncbi:ketopantoate reductase family protein [Candidatus Phyllobacterium onerii]|uniref:ketopantoate reductase family protein n=1 Tax=Candidatus Phyllobacterium onerii TaxID=3020828 RepID=UPI00232F03C5|nr:2-dehydropantoate 2-reductase [Phyllobacterium sp. IY22]
MTTSQPMKVCIYGAGAVGGTIGVLLSLAGAEVSVVAHGETLEAIRDDGLQLTKDGKSHRVYVRVTDNPVQLGRQDYVIVSVKAPALEEVASNIAPLLGYGTKVITAMNGVPWWFFAGGNGVLSNTRLAAVDPKGIIEKAIPLSRTVGCVVYMACSVDAPGKIRHNSGNKLIIGYADNSPVDGLADIRDLLNSAGFSCHVTAAIRDDIWYKLWGNLSINPISLLTGETSDVIINDPLVYELCVHMMQEAAAIGEAIGIPMTVSTTEMIGRAKSLGAFKTSMLQDTEAGKPVELDALLTVAHDIGKIVDVPTPFIDSVLGLARLRARKLGLFDMAA